MEVHSASGGSAAGAGGSLRGSGSRWKRHAGRALKLGGTLGLSVWILSRIDIGRFSEVVAGARAAPLAAVLILFVIGLTISAWKWQLLLRVHGLRYSLGALVRWYLVAGFLNHFLPSSIGGDGYRIYRTWHNPRGRSASVVAILLERITGLAALGFLGLVASAVLWVTVSDALARTIVALGSAATITAGVAFYAVRRFHLLERLRRRSPGGDKLEVAATLIDDLRRRPGELALVGVISFVFHANKVLAVWLILFALGNTASVLEVAVALFAVELAGLVPLSVGGLGLVEGSFMLTMAHFGAAEEVSVAAMLLLRVLVVPLSLAGGVIYFVGDAEKPTGAGVPDSTGAGSRPAALAYRRE